MWMSRTVKDTVDCERRRAPGRRFSPPERQRLRTRAAKRFLWRRTSLANHSLALKDQELPRANSRKIRARWVCLQYKSKMKRGSVYESYFSGEEKRRPQIRPHLQAKDTAAPVNHFYRSLIHTNCISLSRYRIKEHIFPEVHVIPQRWPLV